MTTAIAPGPPSAPAPARPAAPPTVGSPPAKRRRRWLAFAVPFGLLALLWTLTGVAHAVEQPDLGDPGTLSPTGTAGDGSSRLAALLSERGVRIERVTTMLAALQAAAGRDATVFLPTPGYLSRDFLYRLQEAPGNHRAVVVAPGTFSAALTYAPIIEGPRRWAAATVAPACDVPYATAAGRAAVQRSRYAPFSSTFGFTVTANCYGGGLVGVRHNDLETVVVGATDPFRNSRIGENGNAALAVGLLREHEHVIWVDIHAREPVAANIDINIERPQVDLPDYRRDEADRGQTGFPTIDAFPSTLWALFILSALFFVALAVARGRRLGTPVAEPLPVLVPAAESVTGRGRLYERVGARAATLDALRTAAIIRIARVIFAGPAPERDLLRPGPAADAFVAQIAARTGFAEASVHTALYGAPPEDDEQLTAAVAMLDSVVRAVRRDDTQRPPSANPGGTP